MVEKQVHEILLFPQREPVLPPDEAEAVAKFQNELLQPRSQPVLQFALLHPSLQPEELQMVAAFQHLVGLFGQMLRQGGAEIVAFLLRQRPPVGPGFDLANENVPGPAELSGGAEVKDQLAGVLDFAKKVDVMPPRDHPGHFSRSLRENFPFLGGLSVFFQFSRKLREKFRSRAGLEKLAHPPDVGGGKPVHVGERGTKIGGEAFDHAVSPAGFPLFLDDTAPDVPIQQDQLAVDRPPGLNPGIQNPVLHPGKELSIIGKGRFHGRTES